MREKYKSNIAYGYEIYKKNLGIISPMWEHFRQRFRSDERSDAL